MVTRDKVFELKNGAWEFRPGILALLDQDYIAGVTYYDSWGDVEGSQGRYSWEAIKQIVSAAKARNKAINLGLAAAQFSPAWIYQQGVARLSYFNYETNKVESAPLPWDPAYLQKYFSMVADLGKLLRSDPDFFSPVMRVMIAGPSNILGFEPVIDGDSQDQENYLSRGYPEKFVDAWKKAIDFYAGNIPERIELNFAWHFGMRGHWTNQYSNELADYIYQKGLTQRINLMSLELKGLDWWNNDKIFPPQEERKDEKIMLLMFVKEQARGFRLGLQLAMKDNPDRNKFGDYGLALRNAIQMGCLWLEPWVEDILDAYVGSVSQEKRIELLKWASAELRR